MAQEHDLFDDIIEISKGFDFLKNPVGGRRDFGRHFAGRICRLP